MPSKREGSKERGKYGGLGIELEHLIELGDRARYGRTRRHSPHERLSRSSNELNKLIIFNKEDRGKRTDGKRERRGERRGLWTIRSSWLLSAYRSLGIQQYSRILLSNRIGEYYLRC